MSQATISQAPILQAKTSVRTSEIQVNESATLLVTFEVRRTLCALDASSVQEVILYRAPTPIRHAPKEIPGVINLRGKIVTLLDLGLILFGSGAGGAGNSGPSEPGPESRIFIVEDRGEYVGLLVDSVSRVIESEELAAGSLPANIPASQAHYFQGVHRDGGRVVALLNAAEILLEARV